MKSNRETFDASRIRQPGVAYEARDLSHQTVFAFLLILGCGVLLAQIAVWGIFKDLGESQFAGQQTTNPIMTSNEQLREVGGDPAISFPMPQLQPNDIADLNKFRIAEEERLNSYGWVDPSKNRVHIPIERAVDMLGSAWPQQQQTPATAGTSPRRPPEPPDSQTGKASKDERNGNYGW